MPDEECVLFDWSSGTWEVLPVDDKAMSESFNTDALIPI